jgi:signal transduction histidine kinase
MTVRAKLLLYSFVPAFLILGAIAALLPTVNERTAEALAGDRNGEIADLLANQVFNELLGYVEVLDTVASRPEIYGFEPAAQGLALRAFVGQLRVFDAGVVMVDQNGLATAADARRPWAAGEDWLRHAFIQRGLQGSPEPAVVSDIVSLAPEDDVVAIAVPVRAPGQGYQGLIVGLFSMDAKAASDLRTGLARLPAGDRRLIVLDSVGRAVYDSAGETARFEFLPEASPLEPGKPLRLESAETGEEVLSVVAVIPETGWRLVLEEPWNRLAAIYTGATRLLLGLLLLGLLAPAFVVGWGAERVTRPIATLTRAVRSAAAGRLGQQVEVRTGDELELLAEQFNDMSVRLEASVAGLEERVAERTRELNALYEQARETATLAERNRLARELHDSVTQTIFSAKLIADVLPRLWEKDRALASVKLQELRLLTGGALAEMRTLLVELRPAALADGDLAELLKNLAGAAQVRGRMAIHVEVTSGLRLPPEVQEAFYRIAQEGLNNVIKHASAVKVRLRFEANGKADAAEARLEIADDGVGFDLETAAEGGQFGLHIMRERAEAVGAALSVQTAPDEGTQIVLEWCAAMAG